uniref:Leucine rich repeat containing 61 n=1 Tax=Strix occidentalis caurina TaxID=311401 RepID=A0A8D0FY59_STROC
MSLHPSAPHRRGPHMSPAPHGTPQVYPTCAPTPQRTPVSRPHACPHRRAPRVSLHPTGDLRPSRARAPPSSELGFPGTWGYPHHDPTPCPSPPLTSRGSQADPGVPARMAGRGEAAAAEEEEVEEEEEGVRITPQLLKASTGEFALESILLLRLRGRGIAHLGCLGDCANLEWLDLSGNAIAQLGPLAALRSLAVLNLARNRVTSLEPLGSCHNLQSLNVAGNLVSSLHQLRCLTGLRRLESLRLRDPLARLANPLCAAPAYRAALADMFPALKAIDGERVSGRGSELYQLCRDLDSSLGRGDSDDAGPQPLPRVAQPWVEAGFWEPRPPRRSSIMEEAYKQFGEVLQECRELSRRADDTIAQAERALSSCPDPKSFVF